MFLYKLILIYWNLITLKKYFKLSRTLWDGVKTSWYLIIRGSGFKIHIKETVVVTFTSLQHIHGIQDIRIENNKVQLYLIIILFFKSGNECGPIDGRLCISSTITQETSILGTKGDVNTEGIGHHYIFWVV